MLPYVIGVAPSGKVWDFFLFSPPFFGVFFASFPRQGILDYSTPFSYSS